MSTTESILKSLNTWFQAQDVDKVEKEALTRKTRIIAEGLFDVELNDDEVHQIVTTFMERVNVVMSSGEDVSDPSFRPWLHEWLKKNQMPRWERYRDHLTNKGWAKAVLDGLDHETSRLIDLVGNPAAPGNWSRRGLTIGEVQSGKTANYIGVLNKALDVGYKVIVVLGGHTNDLRNQTQVRIDSDLLGADSNYANENVLQTVSEGSTARIGVGLLDTRIIVPHYLTTATSDFSMSSKRSTGTQIGGDPVVAVIKKHKGIINNLAHYLATKGVGGQIDAPLLVIDDESDWASVNTGDEEEVSKVNEAIRNLLGRSTRSSYMAVTATPFANILIDHEVEQDLFPRDYIRALPSPSNYQGVASYLTDEARSQKPDILQTDIADLKSVLPYNHKKHARLSALPTSLREAVEAFIIGTAVRRIRDGERKPASMMVNVSTFNDVQENVFNLIEEFLTVVAMIVPLEMSSDSGDYSEETRQLMKTLRRIYPELDLGWDDLAPAVTDVLAEARADLVNNRTTARRRKWLNQLSREDRQEFLNRPTIFVGGNVLARGLTLEGLQVSYYLRRAGAADTLLQMGRWFGYRPGYEDLVRIWIDEEIVDLFAYTAEISNDLREDLAEMNALGLTPSHFGLKIRKHPETFRITAANKSKSAKSWTGELYIHGRTFESHSLPARRNDLLSNRRAIAGLASKLLGEYSDLREPSGFTASSNSVWRRVPLAVVQGFFREFQGAPDEPFFGRLPSQQMPQLAQYLSDARNGDLWDVAFISGSGPKESDLDGSGQLNLKMSRRSSVTFDEQTMSLNLGNRRVASGSDLEKTRPIAVQKKLREERGTVAQKDVSKSLTHPLLLVYLVDARGAGDKEVNLDVKDLLEVELAACVLSFPKLSISEEKALLSERRLGQEFLVNTVYYRDLLPEPEEQEQEESDD